ncbi:MAG: hypothetical protein WA885_13445 [Phormidesmis sp.]
MLTSASPLRHPALLASAGSWDCAKAAVENGADAIYFGLDNFNARLNARMRAHSFTAKALPALKNDSDLGGWGELCPKAGLSFSRAGWQMPG